MPLEFFAPFGGYQKASRSFEKQLPSGSPVEPEGTHCICALKAGKLERDKLVSEPSPDIQSVMEIQDPPAESRSSLMTILTKSQNEDIILAEVKGWLTANKKPLAIQAHRAPRELVAYWKQFELLRLQDGLIERKWIPTEKQEGDSRHLICIPEEMIETILKLC